MLKRFLAFALIPLLIHATIGSVSAASQSGKDVERANKVKADVMRLGRGSRVKVKRTDGTTVEGTIGEVGEEQFVVEDAKTGSPMTLPYSEVKQVKKRGAGGSNLRGVVLVLAAIAGIVTLGIILDKHDTCAEQRRRNECSPPCDCSLPE